MKKIIILLLVIATSILIESCTQKLVEDEINDFKYHEEFHDSTYGGSIDELFVQEMYIDNYQSANEVAESIDKLWLEVFGNDVKKQRPYVIEYDDEKMIWHIRGNFSYLKGGPGGVAHAIVSEETGEVIYMWHGQ